MINRKIAIGTGRGILFYITEELLLKMSGADLLCKFQDEIMKRIDGPIEKNKYGINKKQGYKVGWNLENTEIEDFLQFEYFRRLEDE